MQRWRKELGLLNASLADALLESPCGLIWLKDMRRTCSHDKISPEFPQENGESHDLFLVIYRECSSDS
jgi:hypothetical protein